METINGLLEFLKLVAITTVSQIIWLLGLIIAFGLILYLFARFTRTFYVKTVGQKLDIIITGWIGTPVHEVGHAVFCILFGHRITEMRLYTPNSTDGTLGYVNHSYNPKSTYQRIGNFFIGVGPILFGTLILYALLYYLVPNSAAVFNSIQGQSHVLVKSVQGDFGGMLPSIWESTAGTLGALFRASNFSDYKFWIFLYISLCVASHMELSPPDIKGAWRGFLSIIIFLVIINILILGAEAIGLSKYFGSWWGYLKLDTYTAHVNKWVGTSGALLLFAAIVSALNFVVTYIILSIYTIISYRKVVNPFW